MKGTAKKQQYGTESTTAANTMSSTLSRALQRLINHLIALARSLLSCLASWWARASQKPLLLDTGRRVYVGRKLAEGGFSYVFEAYDADNNGSSSSSSAASKHQQHDYPPYVLKRVHGDAEVLEACRREAHVHRAISPNDRHHHPCPNVMPLLGLLVAPTHACLLFPYCPTSLRSEIQRRVVAAASQSSGASTNTIRPFSSAPSAPWSEIELLELFWGILCGVRAMHEHRYSHRDIKVDNVLLTATPATSGNSFRHHYHHGNSSSPSLSYTPVLMDFGSAGPLVETIKSRRDQLEALERASTHTTVSYRPPELFEGGVRVGDTLDYEKADVWSLGCTLFASSYGQGASPSECEFVRNVGSGNNFSSTGGAAGVRVVECTHLKVLAGLPQNPPPWYSSGLWSLLEDMLEQDPSRRPTLPVVMERVQHLLQQARGGDGTVSASGVLGGSENNHDRQFAIRPAADNDEGDDDVELANQFL